MESMKNFTLVVYIVFRLLSDVVGYDRTHVISVLNTYCPGTNNCGETSWPCLGCGCDQNCDLKNNCCPKIESNQTVGTEERNYTFRCISPNQNLIFETQIRQNLGVYMVSTCMTGQDDHRCTNSTGTDLIDSLPHTCRKTGIHFRNYFCAKCSGATETLPWKPLVTCSNLNVVKADTVLFPNSVAATYARAITSKDPTCGIEFFPPDNITISQDICYRESFNRTCDTNDVVTSEACDQLTIPYFHTEANETKVYANVFCFKCQTNGNFSGNEPHDPLEIPHAVNTFIAELNHDYILKHDREEMLREVSALVKRYTINPPSCDEGYLYDPYNRECRRWYCPSGDDLVDGVCTPVFLALEKVTYELRLDVVTDNDTLHIFRDLDKYNLTEDLLETMFENDPRIETEILLIAENSLGNGLFIDALLKVVDRINDTISGEFGLDVFENSYMLDVNGESLVLNVSLSQGVKIEVSPFTAYDIIVLDLNVYAAMQTVYMTNSVDVKSLYKYPLLDKLAYCIQIALESYEILDFNDIVDIRVSDVRLLIGDFKRTSNNEQVRICFTDYMSRAAEKLPHIEKPETHSPQAIVSVVCNLLSITGLSATVLTYFIFGELRSIPGKNNMMLAIHLLIAQCLYQFGIQQTEYPKLCIALGVFIHFFWLTSILWMNACTLHMFRTFVTGQSYRSYRALDPQVCMYTLYCYTIAIIVIVINISVSLYKSDGKTIGYGGNVCYISTPTMVGWTFALPVGVIIILNLGFFFAVVYQISASTMSRRGKSNDRANTIIYMKLSTLTGVTWIFGYLYLWTDFVPLEYIFIVLNAGQGVLIFFSFICTSRIIRLYEDLFRKINRSIRHGTCCTCNGKTSDLNSKGIEMNNAKQSHSSSKTLDTAVATTPIGHGTGIPVTLPGGSVMIKPDKNGIVVIGAIMANGDAENRE